MTSTDTVLEKLTDLQLIENKQQGQEWLTKEKIPGFGLKTPAELIAEGYIDDVLLHIKRVANGGFA